MLYPDLEVRPVADAYNSSSADINSLLNTNQRERVVIPTFQRGYMWKKKHVEAFWDDVDKQRKASAAQKGADPHFFGPIVTLSKPTNGIIEILDGQQRLATVTILFSIIRNIGDEIYKQAGVMAAHDLARNVHDQFILRDS